MDVLHSPILLCIIFLISSSSYTLAQQPYVAEAGDACTTVDNSTTVLGYSYNGFSTTCQSYLIFRSQPPYYSVLSIAALLGSDPSQLAQINSVSETATFETNKEVIVPVDCSCSGQYYQANTTYISKSGDTYFSMASNTFQGLTTCQAIQNQSNTLAKNLYAGQRIHIPIRCACPTKNQTDTGIKYLLSYLITTGDYVSTVCGQFGADIFETLQANEISVQSTIYPNTTLLLPLRIPPSSSQTSTASPPPSPPPPPSSPSNNNGSMKTWVYVVIAVAATIAIMFVVFVIALSLFCRKRKRSEADPMFISKRSKDDSILISDDFESYETPLNKKSEDVSSELLASIADIAQSIKVYKIEDLESATENFSPKCWIKGSVYRGTINGDLAAIKRINGDVSKEINLLSKINHFNIIRLSGVCFSEGHWYFVYEYAMNGPLSNWIHGNMSRPKVLSWTRRVNIALDVAMGLNYLHSYTNPPHVHKDIKSNNILLDSDFRAKVANFGLARSTEGQEGDFALTKHIVGTKGYMAPEYLENGLISPKLDVYAFGVMMLELISGKEVVSSQGEDLVLLDVLIAIIHEGNTEKKLGGFIDPSLQANYPFDLALSLARLIENCLRKDPSSRPGMDEIVQSLSRIVATSLTWESSLLR